MENPGKAVSLYDAEGTPCVRYTKYAKGDIRRWGNLQMTLVSTLTERNQLITQIDGFFERPWDT